MLMIALYVHLPRSSGSSSSSSYSSSYHLGMGKVCWSMFCCCKHLITSVGVESQAKSQRTERCSCRYFQSVRTCSQRTAQYFDLRLADLACFIFGDFDGRFLPSI